MRSSVKRSNASFDPQMLPSQAALNALSYDRWVEALSTCAAGRDNIELTRVGLGGVELGPEEGEAPDVGRAVRVLAAAADAGINWIDTAEDYYENRNEAVIGEALARCGAVFYVSTKVGPSRASSGFRADQVRAACQGSLRRLQRDHLDAYLLHWPDDVVPLEETWGTMSELVGEGLVRAIGLSNYDVGDIERCNAQRTVDLVQDGLSLVDHLDARARFARCAELGIPVVVYEPLASGVLSGRTMEEVREIWKDWSEFGFYKRMLAPGRAERSQALVDALRPIASRHGISVAQLALAWVLHQPGVSWALAGSRDGRHVHENAAAAAVDLRASLDELEALIPLGPAFA
jgi:aryl-alcohol dehydrogenase-like predicted oxidoreductase